MLAQSASRGDRESLERLLERYLPELRAFIRLRTGRHILAHETPDDLVQSVCRDVLGALSGFDYRSEQAFKSWLFLNALRKVQDKGRYYGAAKRKPVSPWGDDGDPQLLSGYVSMLSPSRVAIGREDVVRLERAFERLPEEYREVITLHRVLGLDHEQIAARMGRTTNASRVLLHRAIARLSRLLASGENTAKGDETRASDV